MLHVAGLILPLALDTFAISAAAGASDIGGRARVRLSLVFALFEGAMPLVGFLLGAGIGAVIGDVADYLAAGLLIVLGGYMTWPGDEPGEEEAVGRLANAHGLTLLGLGLSVSIDELAIGFSAGLLRLPIITAALVIGAQAFVVSQVGLRIGARVGERLREGAERLAGVALVLLGLALLVGRLA